MVERIEDPSTQVLKCSCGAIVGACIEPDCYTDSQWLRTLKKHVVAGGKVTAMLASEVRKASWNCTCKKESKKK